jgi:hypothetical protein
MKRKMFLLPLVILLLVLLSASTAIADQPPALPHPGLCVAYCARAMAAADINGNGRIETCLVEWRCHRDAPWGCGETLYGTTGHMCLPGCQVAHGPGSSDPGPWDGW